MVNRKFIVSIIATAIVSILMTAAVLQNNCDNRIPSEGILPLDWHKMEITHPYKKGGVVNVYISSQRVDNCLSQFFYSEEDAITINNIGPCHPSSYFELLAKTKKNNEQLSTDRD